MLKQKRLNANELAELDEFKWMRRREDEWKAIARAQQQEETKKYKAELRARLGESNCRCTCHKFRHWEGWLAVNTLRVDKLWLQHPVPAWRPRSRPRSHRPRRSQYCRHQYSRRLRCQIGPMLRRQTQAA